MTGRYVEFLTVVRYLFSMPYRQLEGFTRALNRLIPPSVDYSWVRRRILMLNPSLHAEGFKRPYYYSC
ncbi:MAG: transposase [Candidatus Methanomethylicia archaeon]